MDGPFSENPQHPGAIYHRRKQTQEWKEGAANAGKDPMTGLMNKQEFRSHLDEQFLLHKRYGDPLALLMLDVDGLKKANTNYGHLFGDEVIKEVGKVVRKNLRESDIGAREGGDEFALLLPRVKNPEKDAEEIANRILNAIREIKLTPEEGEMFPLNATIGIATLNGGLDQPKTSQELYQIGDGNLYVGKDMRNRGTIVTSKSLNEAELKKRNNYLSKNKNFAPAP